MNKKQRYVYRKKQWTLGNSLNFCFNALKSQSGKKRYWHYVQFELKQFILYLKQTREVCIYKTGVSNSGPLTALGPQGHDWGQIIEVLNYYYRHNISSPAAKTDPDFKAFLAERNPRQQHSSTLESYLIKPIQRVLKYPLLLRELYSLTDPDSEEHYHLDGRSEWNGFW